MATVNGAGITNASITMPRQGRWTAYVACSTEDDIPAAGDSVTIEPGPLQAVVYDRVDRGATAGLTLVSAPGLDRGLAARHYQAPLLRAVADDIVREAGEALDGASDVTGSLSSWSRPQGRASVLLDLAGLVWRVRRGGAVLVGSPDLGPVVVGGGDVRVLESQPRTGLRVAAVDGFWFEPGFTFEGERIGSVRYKLSREGLRVIYHVVI